jgi:hypothetical protein
MHKIKMLQTYIATTPLKVMGSADYEAVMAIFLINFFDLRCPMRHALVRRQRTKHQLKLRR